MRKLATLGSLPVLLATNAFAKNPSNYLDDVRDFSLAPLHWDSHDWLLAAEAAAATAAAYSVDSRGRHALAPDRPTISGDPHSLRDSGPMALMVVGTLTAGLLTEDPELRTTARDMTEGVALASAGAFALKHAFGRERPDATTKKSAWRSGGDSFPSGHTAAAFAAAQVFVDRRASDEPGWRIAAYSLGALTAYARMQGNMHWLSDTVAGAALGMATGRFVSDRNEADSWTRSSHLSIQPLNGGAMLSISTDPYRFLTE